MTRPRNVMPLMRPLPLSLFALATLAPVGLAVVGFVWGGVWVWAAFLYMAFLAAVLDQIIPLVAQDGTAEEREFPAADVLLVAIAGAHFALLPLAVWAIAGPSGLSVGERGLLAFACGAWLGQVAHPAAHELIHRPSRGLFRAGVAIYASLLIGHHASAHRLVHHRAVATPEDPSSAPLGLGFWTYAPRAWIGSYRAGWAAEDALRVRGGRGGLHPYSVHHLLSVAGLGLGFVIAGWSGVLVWIALALHAQLQILLADYVQHYGLSRRKTAEGKWEPVATRHSWNTPHWFSSALMLNAPRHSDHHAHPARPYPALRLEEDAPLLPWPLPVACVLALWPPTFRKAMKPHVRRWQRVDAEGSAGSGAS
ncbi:MAG: alkane 1-monooxygenase [Cypionkella sp.]|nr:alkane 1-monooxygenase [Cypionkella sp.]